MTQLRRASFWLRVSAAAGVLVAVTSIPSTASAAQGELAQAGPPRFMRPVPGRSAPEEVDVAAVPVLRSRISLEREGVTLGNVLQEITRQSGIKFAYNADMIPLDRPVRLRAASITVGAALTEILIDTHVDVLLKSSTQAVLLRRAETLGGGTVTGRVTDAKTSKGMGGAEVLLEGTRWRTATDTSGNYLLGGVEVGRYTLTVRRVGYKKQSRAVTVRDQQTDTLNIVLEAAAVPLDELVTTATGQQRRRDLGNAITTIRADSVLRTAPINNLSELLDGRVPGMSLQHTTGAPGDPSRIRFRGLGSISRSNDPVVIVDGIRINSDQSSRRAGNLTNLAPASDVNPLRPPANAVDKPAPSPLDQIDPAIIEKIEVFKGPSAATLYGADAANGVIVITTKRGKPGPTQWTASVRQSRQTTAGKYPVGYFPWGRLPALQGGNLTMCTIVARGCVLDSLVSFQALNDPQTTMLGAGHETALTLGASGGNQALTFSIAGRYNTTLGQLQLPAFEAARYQTRFNKTPPDWMQRPHRYEQWGVTSNVTARLGTTADVTLNAEFSSSDQQRSTLEDRLPRLQGAYISAKNGCCMLPLSRMSSDSVRAYDVVFADTVLRGYYMRNTASMLMVRTGLQASWHPKPWFDGSAQAGITIEPRVDEALLPAGLPADKVGPPVFDSGAVSRGTGLVRTGTLGVNGNLRKPLGKGFLFVTTVGADLVTRNQQDIVTSAWNLAPGSEALLNAGHFAAADAFERSSVFGWYVEPRITSQRFSLSTGIRLDGGSSYGTRTSGGLALPKLNGSWVISEEPWFPFGQVFSSLRLRGAYGQAQVQPGVTDRLRLYTYRVNTAEGQSLELTSVGNDALKPERSTEVEGGVDADFLDSRVTLEVTAFRKMQIDALVTTPLPGSVNGGGTVRRNIGNIRNTGVELHGNVSPIRTSRVTWSVDLNYSRLTNTLTKLGTGITPDYQNGLVQGYPLYGRWSRPILGFADQDGDGAIQSDEVQVGDSMVYMGRLLPAYETSVASNIGLFGNRMQISALFQYEAGNTQVDQTVANNWVLVRALSDPTTPFAEQAAVAAFDRTTYGVTQTLSTFRFKSLAVNYTVPRSVARVFRAQDLTLSLRGDNLGIHTNYKGRDPDVTAWSAGDGIVDAGQLARPRTWEFAAFLRF